MSDISSTTPSGDPSSSSSSVETVSSSTPSTTTPVPPTSSSTSPTPPTSSSTTPTPTSSSTQPISTPPPSTPSSSTSPSSTTPSSTPPPQPQSSSTTPNNPGGGASAASVSSASAASASSVAAASAASLTSKASSTITQTSVITSNGVAVTTVVTTLAGSTATTTSTAAAKSSHTGAIVGGVVGGVAALALIGLIAFFFLKKRRSKEEFDGNFDPDRVVGHSTGGGTLPQIDLGEEVTPYDYSPHGEAGVGPGMSQYGDSPYLGGMAAGSHRSTSPPTTPSHYPASEYNAYGQPSSDTSGSHYGPPPTAPAGMAWAAANPGQQYSTPSNASSSATNYSNPRSAKEREALAARYGRQSGLGLATQVEEPGMGGGSAPPGGDGVVVHQDGGRVSEEGPTEIPPTYDSIPDDGRGR